MIFSGGRRSRFSDSEGLRFYGSTILRFLRFSRLCGVSGSAILRGYGLRHQPRDSGGWAGTSSTNQTHGYANSGVIHAAGIPWYGQTVTLQKRQGYSMA
jgi:hypothetical protein